MVLELTLTKLRQAQLGIIFKQEQGNVTIDSIAPHSPGARSGLKPGDVILAIESKNVNTVQQVSKLMKSMTNSSITFRIERVVDNYMFKNRGAPKIDVKPQTITVESGDDAEITQIEQDSFVIVESVKTKSSNEGDAIKKCKSIPGFEKFKTPEKVPKIITSNENVSKIAQTIGNFTLRKRKPSIERNLGDSSSRSTPTPSAPNTPQHTSVKQQSSTSSHLLGDKKHSISEVPEIVRTDSESLDSEILSTTTEACKGQELNLSSVVNFNDEYVFNLKEGYKYLNVNVWGTRANESDILLGYANIPLAHVLYECCSSVLGHYIKSYSFLPPNNINPNR